MPTPTDRELEELKAEVREAVRRCWLLEETEVLLLKLLSSYEERGKALETFTRCAYPVATELLPRGHAWRPEADLDYALEVALQALSPSGGGE